MSQVVEVQNFCEYCRKTIITDQNHIECLKEVNSYQKQFIRQIQNEINAYPPETTKEVVLRNFLALNWYIPLFPFVKNIELHKSFISAFKDIDIKFDWWEIEDLYELLDIPNFLPCGNCGDCDYCYDE